MEIKQDVRYQRQPRPRWAPRQSVCLILLRPYRLSILLIRFLFFLLLLLLDFHLFSTSLVSLLSCHFCGRRSMARRQVRPGTAATGFTQTPRQLQMWPFSGGQVRSAQTNTLRTDAATLLCTQLFKKFSVWKKEHVFFLSKLKCHREQITQLKLNFFFVQTHSVYIKSRHDAVLKQHKNRSVKCAADKLHTYFECRRAQTTRWVTESPPVIICSRGRR